MKFPALLNQAQPNFAVSYTLAVVVQRPCLLIRGCACAVLAFGVFAGTASRTKAQGQIAGRVVRTDTGAPLPDVVVTLEALGASPQCQRGKDRVAKSAADGGYIVPDVPPGCYFVVAYRRGFIGAVYGAPTLQQQGKLVTVTPGKKLDNIDFRLQPAPNDVEIDDNALVDGSSELRLGLRFGRGRFSIDGNFFAFFVNANADINRLWRYDMHSGQLAPLGKGGIDVAWDGDVLYVEDNDSHSNRGPFVEVVTPVGLKDVSQVPPTVAQTFRRDEPDEESINFERQNDRYTVIGENPCHGCGVNVKVRRNGETREHLVAAGLSGFLFDPARSVLIYPKLGLSPALVTVDLGSGTSQTFQLPTPSLDVLLDQVSHSDGYQVAFVGGASCLPEETPDGQNPWILPDNVEYRRQHSFPQHICFVSISAEKATNKALSPR